jgi:hypothetical protein
MKPPPAPIKVPKAPISKPRGSNQRFEARISSIGGQIGAAQLDFAARLCSTLTRKKLRGNKR